MQCGHARCPDGGPHLLVDAGDEGRVEADDLRYGLLVAPVLLEHLEVRSPRLGRGGRSRPRPAELGKAQAPPHSRNELATDAATAQARSDSEVAHSSGAREVTGTGHARRRRRVAGEHRWIRCSESER